MKSFQPFWLLPALLFAAACAANDQGDTNGDEVMAENNGSLEVQELARGSQSQEPSERMMVVKDQDTLQRIWSLAEQRGTLPEIDFDEEMALAVFMGERRTGGYEVRVEEVSRSGDGLKVSVLMRAPGENCMTTQAITRPFQLLRLERVDGEVTFETRQEAVDC